MKRRTFIGLIGASALSLPFILTEAGLGTARRNNRITATVNKVPMRLKLPSDVQTIIGQLGKQSKAVNLLGGTTIAAAAKVDPSYLNLLIDAPNFATVKQSLFEFGVTPIATPALPGNLVRFVYQDRSYNLVNMNFDIYTELSMADKTGGLILFAHNYLIYNATKNFALDPYDALQAKSADGKAFLIKPISQPRTLVHGFEHYLAGTFDCALLGLQPSPEYLQIEDRVINSTPTEQESTEIMAKVLDYSPDVLEVCGLDTLCRMLGAPVCVAAAKSDAEIDLLKVRAKLRRLEQQGADVSSRDFMSAVDAALKKKSSGKGCAGGLPEYLATSRSPFRRTAIVRELCEKAPTAQI